MLNLPQFREHLAEKDALWAAAQLHALPLRFKSGLLNQREKLNKRGDYAGNVYIRKVGEGFKYPASLAASNDDLIAQANIRAAECGKISTVAGMAAICAQFCVELPQARFREDGAACSIAGVMARLKCPLWWRRALRKSMGREIERIGIDLGFVHRRAGCYASDETVSRRKQQKARNRALLESIKAVNENGQEYTLAELSALGVSNPAIRRGELMTRIAGFETLSRGLGHVGEFYTITAPSRFHARLSVSGAVNPKFSGETPRQAQAYLCGVWARARSAMHRAGLRVYGFRVAEAHHDGTPHWHLLVFMAPEYVQQVRTILARYALAEDGDEQGATANRFKAVAIDAKRGTAAGYIAKYISKNIDAHGVDVDLEGNEAKSGAERVDSWASCWGIRQFQQIGGAPVSVWRELRRLEAGATDSAIDRAARAADLGDWAGFLQVMGGAVARRGDMPLCLWKEAAEKAGRYGDEGLIVVGVVEVETQEAAQTRVHVWEIKRGGKNETGKGGNIGFPGCGNQRAKAGVDGDKAEVIGGGFDGAGGKFGADYWEIGGLAKSAKGFLLGFEVWPVLTESEFGAWKKSPETLKFWDGLGLDVGAVFSRPWSPVNNCTQERGVDEKRGVGDRGKGVETELRCGAASDKPIFTDAGEGIYLGAGGAGRRNDEGNRKTEKSGAAGERWQRW